MTPRAIFFDLDQTLVQNTRAIGAVLTESLGRLAPDRIPSLSVFGSELSASGSRHWPKVIECAGRGEQLLMAMLTEALSASGFDPAHAAQLLNDLLQGITASTTITANAVVTLDQLRTRGIAIGVITNGLTILQTAKLRAHGLYDRVDTVVTSEDAGAHKPEPRIFELALSKLGAAPADAWHVGDNHDKDIVGAHAAGMTGILFAPPGTRASDSRAADTLGSDSPRLDYPVIGDLLELTGLVRA